MNYKKYTPYVLPLLVVVVVFFLLYRWYSNRGVEIDRSLIDEGVSIEELSPEEASSLSQVDDVETVDLQMPEESSDQTVTGGSIRYEVTEGTDEEDSQVRFSVSLNRAQTDETDYHVYLKEVDGEVVRKAFTLRETKGGYLGSAAISADLMPLEVLVSTQDSEEAVAGDYVLKGTINPGE